MAEFLSGANLKKSLKGTDWYKDRMETQQKYEAGEITDTERALSNVAGHVGALYTPVDAALGYAFESLPEFAQEGLMSAAGAAGDFIESTAAYQSAQELAEEYPRTADVLSDVGEISTLFPLVGAAKKASSGSVAQRIVENAPNELPTFYKGNPVGEMIAAVPSTLTQATKEALSPRARAAAREGINTRLRSVLDTNEEISRLYAKKASGDALTKAEENKIKFLEFRHQADLEKIAKTRDSFLEGQMEQSALFGIQKTGDVPDALKTFHSNYSFSDFGPLNRKTLDIGFTGRPDLESTYKAKDPSKFQFVIKKNNAFTNLTQEARMKIASQTGKRMFQVKQALAKIDPDKKSFKNVDELQEFIALRFLDDSSKVKKYLGYKKRIENGERMTKTQTEAYSKLREVVDKQRDNIAFVNKTDGQVAVRSSHVSQAKAAGGVGDIFVFDLDGNVLHTMTDKNDLAAIPKTDIELEFPKGSKMITMTEPYTYNLFGKKPPRAKYAPDSRAFREGIERKTGVPFEETGGLASFKKDLMSQVKQGIRAYEPTVTREDYLGAASNVALPTREEQGGR
jgi:hypothetical protein